LQGEYIIIAVSIFKIISKRGEGRKEGKKGGRKIVVGSSFSL